jgi:hypothetical protein
MMISLQVARVLVKQGTAGVSEAAVTPHPPSKEQNSAPPKAVGRYLDVNMVKKMFLKGCI